jgi:hypothetical protein
MLCFRGTPRKRKYSHKLGTSDFIPSFEDMCVVASRSTKCSSSMIGPYLG